MRSVDESLALAIAHQQAGRLQDADRIYREILAADPCCVAAWHLIGRLAHQVGNYNAAARCLRRAVELKSDFPEAFNDLGTVFKDTGKIDGAVVFYRRALELKPDLAESHYNLGLVYQDQGRLEEAVACYDQALLYRPDLVPAFYNLGLALQKQGKLDDAIATYQRTLEFAPEHADALCNLGLTLHEQARFDEAIACYERALAVKPEHVDARCNRAVTMLLLGDLERGLPEYEWRWRTGRLPLRAFPQPRWNGESLAGKTVLLHAEQGLGDTFQFIRYAPPVKVRGATVVVECQKPLTKLLANCPGIDQLIGCGDDLPAFDIHAPLVSLPWIFGTTLETIPANIPYLFADASLADFWRERLKDFAEFRIGVNWRGRAGQGTFHSRDIPLKCFALLGRVPGVRLISLQKTSAGSAEQSGNADEMGDTAHPTIVEPGADFDESHGAFMDTAAIMMNLDLVITSDTSVAHLAGALGVPVWIALPFVPDWRWLLDRTDSPWYPTMRLFRQKRPGDWDGVFDEIRAALEEVVSGRSAMKDLRHLESSPPSAVH